MITHNVILRVFRVRCNGQQGTAFVVDVEDKQYLVSAKHVFNNYTGIFSIEIFHEQNWRTLLVELIGHDTDADVSVLAAPQILASRYPVCELALPSELFYSQTVYFLGFPYQFYGDLDGEMAKATNGFPMPFVKSATLSMIPTSKDNILYLDGINNPGFSGGPVVCQPFGQSAWKFAGVISGYVSNGETVLDNGQNTGLVYWSNTGLIRATPIGIAIDIIKANPRGCSYPNAEQ